MFRVIRISEYSVELSDPQPTKGVGGMDRILIKIQGNEDTIKDVIDVLVNEFWLIDYHKVYQYGG